ncbi:hypothetical protein LNQ03_09235 [Klebsiella pneumoniae subsp. pneumoniae]|nr:hypothetical protein [Klebsiella pneumoniae subsp. pneumoniae]
MVVNGLLSQGAVIGKEFANTTTTISQALQVAGNNVTKFFLAKTLPLKLVPLFLMMQL